LAERVSRKGRKEFIEFIEFVENRKILTISDLKFEISKKDSRKGAKKSAG
jgi:hypothetical protein